MPDFSYQLYSSRKFGPLPETLKMVADAGYTQVEGYGALFDDSGTVDALEAGLKDNGLAMPTAHISVDTLEDAPDAALALADRLEFKAIFAPFLMPDDRPSDRHGWAAFGSKLAELGKPVWDAGLAFGWHNHDFEFVDIGGTTPEEQILAADDRLALELDTAWVVKGGHDPVDWIERYGARVVSAHIKDIAAPGQNADEDGWADVGHGTIDWAPIVTALRAAGTAYWVMEHDNPNDDARFATRSFATANAF